MVSLIKTDIFWGYLSRITLSSNYAFLQGILWNSVVYERITLNWSSTSKLCWSNGKKTIQYVDNTDEIYTKLDDISVKMKQRALAGYGLKVYNYIHCSVKLSLN